MGTAIFMVLMVCGYWYASRDLSTRLKYKRTFGWDVYFLVALYGCIFVLQGLIATAAVEAARWIYFHAGGRLPFHLLAAIAGMIVVFFLAGLLKRVREREAALA